jgi:hypothetical protein
MEVKPAYQVVKQSDSYAVVDSGGGSVVTCQNELNAHHYAELLNRAYDRGFKAGYKTGKIAIK